MDITLFLAKIIGIYALVGGLSGLFYAERMQKAMAEATKSYLLPYFDGAIALLTGLMIVMFHNMWETPVQMIVSAVGWIAIIEGLAMMLLPHKMIMGVAKALTSKQAAMGWSIVAILIGAYLVYMGFLV